MFRLRYVHKVAQRCKCGRTQYEHSREPREDEKSRYPHPGQRVYGEGPFVRFHDGVQTCDGFEPEYELKDLQLDEKTLADRSVLAAALREQRVMMRGSRVREYRIERNEDKSVARIVVFPEMPGMSTYWHSIIITPEVQS